MTDLSRRNVLATGAIAAAGVTLAACSSGDENSTAPTADTGASPQASPAASGEALTAAADVPVGGGVIIESGQTKVVVTQPEAGDYVGLSAVCPHQGCLVSEIVDATIVCPCHGSEFSITDGAVIQGPATTGLESVPVTLDGDQIVLA
jgi:Rieske Fe-S protein